MTENAALKAVAEDIRKTAEWWDKTDGKRMNLFSYAFRSLASSFERVADAELERAASLTPAPAAPEGPSMPAWFPGWMRHNVNRPEEAAARKYFDQKAWATLSVHFPPTPPSAAPREEGPREIMRNALLNIQQSHTPDQPAESQADEVSWVMQHVDRLRKIAADALDKVRDAPPPSPPAAFDAREFIKRLDKRGFISDQTRKAAIHDLCAIARLAHAQGRAEGVGLPEGISTNGNPYKDLNSKLAREEIAHLLAVIGEYCRDEHGQILSVEDPRAILDAADVIRPYLSHQKDRTGS